MLRNSGSIKSHTEKVYTGSECCNPRNIMLLATSDFEIHLCVGYHRNVYKMVGAI